jgi:hypothetical protein
MIRCRDRLDRRLGDDCFAICTCSFVGSRAIRKLSGRRLSLPTVPTLGLAGSFVMCPAERGPPAAAPLGASVTKRSTAQKADYVAGHIIGKLRELALIEGAAGVGDALM